MSDDSLPRIAIVGAGPIGLEAALYGRFLGYPVAVLERDRVAANVRRWGHVRMFSPFLFCRSNLGLSALAAQDRDYEPPADDRRLTGAEYFQRYLLPLAWTDLLAESIREGCRVDAVNRQPPAPGSQPPEGDPGDGSAPFHVLTRAPDGTEEAVAADILLDCSGIFTRPNWLGQDGEPVAGEREARPRIAAHLPDVLDTERDHYANQRVLVVGGGCAAATTVTGLAELRRTATQTAVTWVTRGADAAPGEASRGAGADWPARERLFAEANQLVRDGSREVAHWPETWLEGLCYDDRSDSFQVRCGGRHAGEHRFDRIVANVGYRSDTFLYGPMLAQQDAGPIAAEPPAMGQVSGAAGDGKGGPAATGPPAGCAGPGLYLLGSQTGSRDAEFHLAAGFRQIREVFAQISGRATLDLYGSFPQPMV
jgi:thioredoxin reductase